MTSPYTKTRGIVLAATSSGVGKTTVTAALCSALRRVGYTVQPFKTGPDFVDPTYLTLAARRTCRNLDGFANPDLMPFLYAEGCRARRNERAADIAVIEGVMGMYDGLGAEGLHSTAWLAKTLRLPVILLVDAHAAATSVAATVKGFASLEPLAPSVSGVIANRVSGSRHAELIEEALERFTHIPLLAWLPDMKETAFPSRHLGLIPALERESSAETIERYTDALTKHVDLERIVSRAAIPEGPFVEPRMPEKVATSDGKSVRVAIANDDAFCFHYTENRDVLEKLGAELCDTSPLSDASLPQETDLLVLPGGYPEEFLEELEGNVDYRASVTRHVRRGAIYAECGGMLYLTKSIEHKNRRGRMVGLIAANAVMTPKLQRFGYVTAEALEDNLLFSRGEALRAHEFHYSAIENLAPHAFRVRRASGAKGEWIDGYAGTGGTSLLATYLHLNFYSCPGAVQKMLARAAER